MRIEQRTTQPTNLHNTSGAASDEELIAQPNGQAQTFRRTQTTGDAQTHWQYLTQMRNGGHIHLHDEWR
jgi:hypothetical protein